MVSRRARGLHACEIAFNRAIDEWLERFGHRCVDELDIGSPRWAETPEIVAGLARQLATSAHDPSTALTLRNESQSRLRQMPWGVRHALAWVMRKAEEGVRLRIAHHRLEPPAPRPRARAGNKRH